MLTLCEGTCTILRLMDVEMVLDPSRTGTLKACYLFLICSVCSFALVLFGFRFLAEVTVRRPLLAAFAFPALFPPPRPLGRPG